MGSNPAWRQIVLFILWDFHLLAIANLGGPSANQFQIEHLFFVQPLGHPNPSTTKWFWSWVWKNIGIDVDIDLHIENKILENIDNDIGGIYRSRWGWKEMELKIQKIEQQK